MNRRDFLENCAKGLAVLPSLFLTIPQRTPVDTGEGNVPLTWHLMEDAPRDGTSVILRGSPYTEHGLQIAFWVDEKEIHEFWGHEIDHSCWLKDDEMQDLIEWEPTGWRYLEPSFDSISLNRRSNSTSRKLPFKKELDSGAEVTTQEQTKASEPRLGPGRITRKKLCTGQVVS